MPYEYIKNDQGLYVCGICNQTKRLQSTMHYHLKKHEGKLPFECTACNKGFLHASTLELHKKAQHQKEQERLFKCPFRDCPYEGTLTKANLMIHYVRKHCKEEAAKLFSRDTSTCVKCEKVCKSMTAFHYHAVSCLELGDPVRKAHLLTFG